MNTVVPPGQQDLASLNPPSQNESAMSSGEMKESQEGNETMDGADPEIQKDENKNAKVMATSSPPGPKKTIAFYSIIIALAFTGLLTALEATIVSTALPTVICVLGGGDLYIWAANIYFLTTYVPLTTLCHLL